MKYFFKIFQTITSPRNGRVMKNINKIKNPDPIWLQSILPVLDCFESIYVLENLKLIKKCVSEGSSLVLHSVENSLAWITGWAVWLEISGYFSLKLSFYLSGDRWFFTKIKLFAVSELFRLGGNFGAPLRPWCPSPAESL